MIPSPSHIYCVIICIESAIWKINGSLSYNCDISFLWNNQKHNFSTSFLPSSISSKFSTNVFKEVGKDSLKNLFRKYRGYNFSFNVNSNQSIIDKSLLNLTIKKKIYILFFKIMKFSYCLIIMVHIHNLFLDNIMFLFKLMSPIHKSDHILYASTHFS